MHKEHGGKSGYAPYEVVPINDVSVDSRTTNELTLQNMSTSYVFANIKGSKEDIYPPTINKIAQEQRKDCKLKKYFRSDLRTEDKDKNMSVKVIDVRGTCPIDGTFF